MFLQILRFRVRASSDFSGGACGIPADRAWHLVGGFAGIFTPPVDLSAYCHAAFVTRVVNGSGDLLCVARAFRAGCPGALPPSPRRRLLPRPGIAMSGAGKSEVGAFVGVLAFRQSGLMAFPRCLGGHVARRILRGIRVSAPLGLTGFGAEMPLMPPLLLLLAGWLDFGELAVCSALGRTCGQRRVASVSPLGSLVALAPASCFRAAAQATEG